MGELRTATPQELQVDGFGFAAFLPYSLDELPRHVSADTAERVGYVQQFSQVLTHLRRFGINSHRTALFIDYVLNSHEVHPSITNPIGRPIAPEIIEGGWVKLFREGVSGNRGKYNNLLINLAFLKKDETTTAEALAQMVYEPGNFSDPREVTSFLTLLADNTVLVEKAWRGYRLAEPIRDILYRRITSNSTGEERVRARQILVASATA